MKKSSEFRLHAQECRALAARMERGEQRDQLNAMAENWDEMAAERADLIRRYPELAHEGEADEEAALDG
jgi:hypothetical protein